MAMLARLRLEHELALWRQQGQTPRLWWRDDDARAPSPALDRLLTVLDGAPIALAVVPDGDMAALAARLADSRGVTVSQHGADHVNHRAAGEAAGEYAVGTQPGSIAARVAEGRRRMTDAGLEPAFYTPPWNRVDEALPAALADCGYQAISAWGERDPSEGALARLDTHVDLLRWKGGGRFRGAGRFLGDLRAQFAARRAAGDFTAAVGVLTHHLDHDEEAWRFLPWFVDFARLNFAWGGFAQLMRSKTA